MGKLAAALTRMLSRPSGTRALVLAVLTLEVGLLGGSMLRSAASAQEWPFPACPRPLAAAKWSAPEAPTRAIAAQSWFKLLQAKIPAVLTPAAMMALGPNEPVAACRVPVSGPATTGLGVAGDVSVVVVTKVVGGTLAIEEVARFDSSSFEVFLPPSLTAEANPAFTLGGMGPSWPVLTVGATASSDQQLLDALMADVFASPTEVVAMRPYLPDQPGMTRVDRLVVGDSCGTVGLSVRIRAGILSIDSGTVPSCTKGSVRRVLVSGATIRIDSAGRLTIATSASSAVLSSSPRAAFTPTLVRSYRAKGRTNSLATPIQVGSGALRSFGGSDGCNDVSTAIAFSANRFIIDPSATMTLVDCGNVKPNAFTAMLQSTTRTGTYVRRGSGLTLTFGDKAVAVLIAG